MCPRSLSPAPRFFLAVVLACTFAGCRGGSTDEADSGIEGLDHPQFPSTTLRIGVLRSTDPAPEAFLTSVQAQKGEWTATRAAQVEVVGVDDPDSAAGPRPPDSLDLLIFPGSRLGDLTAAGWLAPWTADRLRATPTPDAKSGVTSHDDDEDPATRSEAESPLAFAAILPTFRDQWIRDRGRVVALPIGTSALVLVYRRDAFNADDHRKAAADQGLTLAPPESFEQLDALARFFHGRDLNGDGQPDAGLAVALGEDPAEGVADAVFLARAAACGFHPDQLHLFTDGLTGASRIASPPFVDSLEKTAAWAACGLDGAASFDADAARNAYRDGRAAMLIDRAERVATWSSPKSPVPSAVIPLPGSSRLYDPARSAWTDRNAEAPAEASSSPPRLNHVSYLLRGGGWFVGVRAGTPHTDAAFDLAAYLASPETSFRFILDRQCPALPVRSSFLGADRTDPRLDIRGWGRAVARTLTGQRLVSAPREAGLSPGMAALRKARLDVVAGRQSAQSALDQAAQAWPAPAPPSSPTP
jgi:multiple sugar transport system substrate-binding protein